MKKRRQWETPVQVWRSSPVQSWLGPAAVALCACGASKQGQWSLPRSTIGRYHERPGGCREERAVLLSSTEVTQNDTRAKV